MRLPIWVWIVVSLNLFAVCITAAVGWIAQDIAGRAAEERLATEMVANVSKFIDRNTFPLSNAMMNYLGELLDAHWIAQNTSSGRILGSSLSADETANFVKQFKNHRNLAICEIAGIQYRVAVHATSGNSKSGRDSGDAARRLYLLTPQSKFVSVRSSTAARVESAMIPVAILATIMACVLSFAFTRPVHRLTQELIRMAHEAAADHQELGAPGSGWSRAIPPKQERDSARRTLLTTGPAETRRLAEAFYDLWDRLLLAQQRLMLSERLATLGKLSVSVAHELRNPLSGIKMNLRVLQDQAGVEQDPSFVAIGCEIDRMALYVNELMEFAVQKETVAQPIAEPVELSSLVEGVIALLAARMRHGSVQVDFAYSGAATWVDAIPNKIRQVIINLFINAIEAMPAGGEIKISIARKNEFVRLIVADNGHGIPDSDEDVFDAFVSHKPNGVGLGLYLSKQIMEAHGGAIGFEPQERGSLFWLDIPTSRGLDTVAHATQRENASHAR
ncbi:MAG: sensor histidine kinase [Phycisphaerae bacterium]